ncbi:hypothetical protein Rt10032_c10g4184 [Rhodotorula toruloides]|uniref:Uncharacterized protein n=1 Tax=Rhodotorula toruloides TaxID=5286 RepID=A0A511KIH7_RHOTO|nr:hypothetical protein Rt10032_c10g4184 [Rhodotorula toruloides]
MLVKSPTLAAVTTRAANELLVRIDIGGQSTFTTTVETLLTAHDEGSVPSGKLGEFVESILDEVRRDLARDDEQPSPSQVSARHLVVPALLHSDDDSRISSMSRAPSFAPWPILRSPFPFADNCAPGEAAGGVVFHGAEDPTSPIDPLVSTAAAVLTAKNILSASRCAGGVRAPILSPALEPCDVERVCVVESHTAVAGRHKSIRPDLGHMFSVGPAASSPLPFVVSSTGARFDDCATFGFSDALQGGLGPFFDVVSGQAHESVALFSRPSWPVDSSPSPSSPVTGAMIPVPDVNVPLQHVVERKSLDYGFTDETLEDIVALSAGRELHGPSTASNSDARKPSLCANEPAGLKQAMVSEDLTAPRCPAPPVSLDDSTMHIFLDRTDAALSSATHNSDLDTSAPLQAGDSTYSCLLTFFRTARLPPSLVLPRETSTNGSPDVDPLYLSLFSLHPSTLFALATSLRTVAAEARWLGCPAVQAACEVERKRVQRVVDWLLGANRGGQNEKQVVGAEGQAARAGWI